MRHVDADRDRRIAAAERTRIARDLHDSAGHAINVILVHAGLGRMRAGNGEHTGRELETIEQVAREAVGEIDQLVRTLRGPSAELKSPSVEPPIAFSRLEALVHRHRAGGMDVSVEFRGPRESLTLTVDRSAYRVLQEALTNAARHGTGSAHVKIEVTGSALRLTVTNPLGAHPSTRTGGHGLVGMRERATLLGGTVETEAEASRFTLRVSLPLEGGAGGRPGATGPDRRRPLDLSGERS